MPRENTAKQLIKLVWTLAQKKKKRRQCDSINKIKERIKWDLFLFISIENFILFYF